MAFGDNFRERTVSDDAVYAKFHDRPLQGYEPVFLALAHEYNIDPNWAISYLQMESGFGSTEVGLINPTNPWDILCWPRRDDVQNWRAIGQYVSRGGYCYAVYPDVRTGLEAGFKNWAGYVDQYGVISWHDTLCIAVSGYDDWIHGKCDEKWVSDAIDTGQYNIRHWPYVAPPTDPGGIQFVSIPAYVPPYETPAELTPIEQQYQPVYGAPSPLAPRGNVLISVGLVLAGVALLVSRKNSAEPVHSAKPRT